MYYNLFSLIRIFLDGFLGLERQLHPQEGVHFIVHDKFKLLSLDSLALHWHALVMAGDILSSTGEQLSCWIATQVAHQVVAEQLEFLEFYLTTCLSSPLDSELLSGWSGFIIKNPLTLTQASNQYLIHICRICE